MFCFRSCQPARILPKSISVRTACLPAPASFRKIVVDCSTIGVDDSADIRKRLKERGVAFIAAPVSGNAKVIKAGKLSAVISGPEDSCKTALPLIEVFLPLAFLTSVMANSPASARSRTT